MDFLSDFIVFALIAQVILFQLLFLLPEISKLKFSKTKSPRIDPFVSFPFNMLRNRRKNRQRKREWKEKWWARVPLCGKLIQRKLNTNKMERKKESSLRTGQGKKFFKILFSYIIWLIVFKRAFSSFSFVAAWIQCGLLPGPSSRAPLSTVCLLC